MKEESNNRSSANLVATAIVFFGGTIIFTFGDHDRSQLGGIVMFVSGMIFILQTVLFHRQRGA